MLSRSSTARALGISLTSSTTPPPLAKAPSLSAGRLPPAAVQREPSDTHDILRIEMSDAYRLRLLSGCLLQHVPAGIPPYFILRAPLPLSEVTIGYAKVQISCNIVQDDPQLLNLRSEAAKEITHELAATEGLRQQEATNAANDLSAKRRRLSTAGGLPLADQSARES